MSMCHATSRRAIMSGIRNKLHLNQTQLAQRLEVDRTLIVKVENGSRKCTDELWQRFSDRILPEVKGDVQAILRGMCEGGAA